MTDTAGTFVWIRRDGGALCLAGHPFRVVRPGPGRAPFGLEQDGWPPLPFFTLASAKLDALRRARELDEFKE